jgi:hypothetical protein
MTAPGFHPFADVFPLLDGGEFDKLVADIRAHGVREKIWLYEGKILDGRNRYRAAQVAGVPCPTRVFDGDDPVGFVISLNVTRQHLTTSQRAMIAARLATFKDGQRADLVAGTSIEEAARRLNVGHASVERDKMVHEQGGPELIRAVDTGGMSVAHAVEQVRRGIITGVGMHLYGQRGHDLYETPRGATLALLDVESFDGTIWEPANGQGAISNVLRAAGYRVVATDLVDYDCPDATGGVDFLAQSSAPAGVTTILTNPPFMHANAFVRHALALAPRVVMLLRLLCCAIPRAARQRRLARQSTSSHRKSWPTPPTHRRAHNQPSFAAIAVSRFDQGGADRDGNPKRAAQQQQRRRSWI